MIARHLMAIVAFGSTATSRCVGTVHPCGMGRWQRCATTPLFPVFPVFYPDVKEILGKPVVRDLTAISEPVDILDVFRRPSDLPPHLPDILALKPKVVWLQSGIRCAGCSVLWGGGALRSVGWCLL